MKSLSILLQWITACVFFTLSACNQESLISINCDPQVQVGSKATLTITRHSKGFAQENKNDDGDFDYALIAGDASKTKVEKLSDTAHSFCMSTNVNTSIGLRQKSQYEYSIHLAAAGADTSLLYIDCFKPIYRIITKDSLAGLNILVKKHMLGAVKDTVRIEVVK